MSIVRVLWARHKTDMAKNIPLSPLAPKRFPNLLPIAGVELCAAYAGIRYAPPRDDLLGVFFPEGTTFAGCYTRSLTASPAVRWCQQAQQASRGQARALLVLAGNSMAGTGAHGAAVCQRLASALAQSVGCPPEHIQISATGVIGEPLEPGCVLEALPKLLEGRATMGWERAARAILTTDTFPKGICRIARIDGMEVVINGFAKGSGMIAPNMATMLAYLFTNARLSAEVLQTLLTRAVAKTFNCITVDSDTSTSDTVQLFATGQNARHGDILTADDPRLAHFATELEAVCLSLAQGVVKDGEGAQKFITIDVRGARNDEEAHTLAMSIANAPLVKTALAGGDANWGRIIMALGKAYVPINPDAIAIAFGGTLICENGQRIAQYEEAPVAAHLAGRDIHIAADVGVGSGQARVYTCDLTQGYIQINGDYRS
jgi:glutamate N-acetyltransferase/amino-acid N-acetyltransferase